MKLTEHFSLSELEVTSTGLVNKIPDFNTLQNLYDICLSLEFIRASIALRAKKDLPIRITSGYRSSEVNKAVGGVSNSAHLKGCAVDITCDDFDLLLKAIDDVRQYRVDFDQIIIYRERKFVHFGISQSSVSRKQVLYK